MSRIFILLVVIIFIAVGTVVILTQNNTSTTTPPITLNDTPTPTYALISPTNPILGSSTTATSSASQSASISPTPIPTTAIIQTAKGNITLTLYTKDAPKTVANFVSKANAGFYKNLTFHRVEDWVVQGGDPAGNGTGGGKMQTEINSKPFITGSLGMARGSDINVTNDAQFFITKSDASWLNNQYTNFGIVTSGMDVINKLQVGDKILDITTQ